VGAKNNNNINNQPTIYGNEIPFQICSFYTEHSAMVDACWHWSVNQLLIIIVA